LSGSQTKAPVSAGGTYIKERCRRSSPVDLYIGGFHRDCHSHACGEAAARKAAKKGSSNPPARNSKPLLLPRPRHQTEALPAPCRAWRLLQESTIERRWSPPISRSRKSRRSTLPLTQRVLLCHSGESSRKRSQKTATKILSTISKLFMRKHQKLATALVFLLAAALLPVHALTPDKQPGAAERAWDVLAKGIANKNPSLRIDALQALSNIGAHPKAIKLTLIGLADEDPDVRQVAAITLGEMKAYAAIRQLRTALADDPAPQVAFAAARALWQLGDRSGRAVLLEVLAGERKTSDGILQSEIRDIRRRVRDRKGLALTGAAKGAGALFGPIGTGLSLAHELKKGSATSARALSATLLTNDSDPRTLAALRAALSDTDWNVRQAAATALGRIGRPQVISALDTLLQDDKPEVRYAAAAAMVKLTSRKTNAAQFAALP
jgi:HEAT repeat protein